MLTIFNAKIFKKSSLEGLKQPLLEKMHIIYDSKNKNLVLNTPILFIGEACFVLKLTCCEHIDKTMSSNQKLCNYKNIYQKH